MFERAVPTLENNSCSSTESTPTAQPFGETADQGNCSHQLRGMAPIQSF